MRAIGEIPGDAITLIATWPLPNGGEHLIIWILRCAPLTFLGRSGIKGLLREPLLYPGWPMDRVAVFVDAGYLYAQGSAALNGSKLPRTSVTLDPLSVVNRLKALAMLKAPECKLLRIYWYDGAIGGTRPTSDQAALANLDDVKLRLGFVNSSGQQKGVDSLIVTDLIELSRLKSICDAIVLSGDEDIRIGVQISQNYGVRVHLLGIQPSRGSQSHQLLQEADTTTEWSASDVRSFLSARTGMLPESGASVQPVPETTHTSGSINHSDTEEIDLTAINSTVSTFVENLSAADLQGISAYWETGARGIPPELDRALLPKCRDALGRSLESTEKHHMRRHFRQRVQRRLGTSPA